MSELHEALDLCGFRLANWEVRKMIEDYDSKATKTKGKLVFSEFKKVDFVFTSFSVPFD